MWWTPLRIDGALVATTSVRQAANELAALSAAAPNILTSLLRSLVGTDGPTLKKFIEGARWANLMGNIERSIKGPFYFGADPCCCDFFLLQALDWREATFEQLKSKLGVDVMAPYPKAVAVATALRAAPGYANYKGGLKMMGPVKDEIIDSYNDAPIS